MRGFSPKAKLLSRTAGTWYTHKYPCWQSLFRNRVYLPSCVSAREQREICPLVTEWGQSIVIGVTKAWQFLPLRCNESEQITAILWNICSSTPTDCGHGLQANASSSAPGRGSHSTSTFWTLKGITALVEKQEPVVVPFTSAGNEGQ